MNQKERMKAYEQQRQQANENKKKQGSSKLNHRKSEMKTKNKDTKMGSARKVQSVKTSTTKKVQSDSVGARQVQSDKRNTPQRQVQSDKRNTSQRQVQSDKRSASQRQVRSDKRSASQRQIQSQMTGKRQLERVGERKQINEANKQFVQAKGTKPKNTSGTVRKTQAQRAEAIRRKQTEPLRAKKGPKAKNISIENVVKKVSQVSQDVKEGIQEAVYYIGVTLEKAKEREEQEEKEEINQDYLWNTSQVERKNVTRVSKVENRTKTKFSDERINTKKRSPVKNWFYNLIRGSKLEVIVTACVAMLVLVVGGSVISGMGNSKDNTENDNPIRNLIDMMDFVNSNDKSDKEESKEEFNHNGDSSNLGEETGITGNYTMLTASGKIVDTSRIVCPSWIDRQFLTVNEYSRSGVILDKIESIVIHYVGNAGTTAQNNRDYFESLKDKKEASKSSHFVVGLEGEVIQCIPLNEKSYASNHRNSDTISIEVCHPSDDGKFTDVTYDSVVKLTAWLCQNFGLKEENIIRHFDVTGKSCPKYFVDHEDEWDNFKADVMNYMEENPNIK